MFTDESESLSVQVAMGGSFNSLRQLNSSGPHRNPDKAGKGSCKAC